MIDEKYVQGLVDKVRAGERRALAQAITLVESERHDHRSAASSLLKSIMPSAGVSFRIGISGIPGVGKSTFIEAFGNYIIDQGHRVAVLAVDPSSPITGGSILGDKTRMESLARRDHAFIRPSAAGGVLGGVTRRTREAMLLCEAAGFDYVLVETVGVGQSETAVANMTDMFILLLLPGSGDDLQGIKRGVTELADLILINKADGDLADAARHTSADYQNALQFIHPRAPDWSVPVKTCSAMAGEGMEEVWSTMKKYRETVSQNDTLNQRRGEQVRSWFWEEVSETLINELKQHPGMNSKVAEIERAVADHRIPPTVAARELVDLFMRGKKQ